MHSKFSLRRACGHASAAAAGAAGINGAISAAVVDTAANALRNDPAICYPLPSRTFTRPRWGYSPPHDQLLHGAPTSWQNANRASARLVDARLDTNRKERQTADTPRPPSRSTFGHVKSLSRPLLPVSGVEPGRRNRTPDLFITSAEVVAAGRAGYAADQHDAAVALGQSRRGRPAGQGISWADRKAASSGSAAIPVTTVAVAATAVATAAALPRTGTGAVADSKYAGPMTRA